MGSNSAESPISDIGFLARSNHRVDALAALMDGPLQRSQLASITGASAPTVGRILADFEDRRWVKSTPAGYETTPLGAFVAERFMGLHDAMETERKLRDVWRWLPREMDGFSVDLFADAVVSYPGPGYPYEPVERVSRLIEGSTMMRGFGTTVFKSINNEVVCEAILTGLDYEYIFTPAILEATVAWDPKRVAQAAQQDNCTILVHEDLPDRERCGLGIFDNRAGICCHDADTGMLEAVIDTDAPQARQWALAVYEEHREEARPVREEEKANLFPPELVA